MGAGGGAAGVEGSCAAIAGMLAAGAARDHSTPRCAVRPGWQKITYLNDGACYVLALNQAEAG